MSLALCYACRNPVPDGATRCSQCTSHITYGGGNPNRDTSDDGFIFAAVIIVVGAVMLCTAGKWLIDSIFLWIG